MLENNCTNKGTSTSYLNGILYFQFQCKRWHLDARPNVMWRCHSVCLHLSHSTMMTIIWFRSTNLKTTKSICIIVVAINQWTTWIVAIDVTQISTSVFARIISPSALMTSHSAGIRYGKVCSSTELQLQPRITWLWSQSLFLLFWFASIEQTDFLETFTKSFSSFCPANNYVGKEPYKAS